jgi:hypothetical protein
MKAKECILQSKEQPLNQISKNINKKTLNALKKDWCNPKDDRKKWKTGKTEG